MNDLGGVYAKLHRANEHADELLHAEAEFRARSPSTVAESIEDGWHVFRAVITRPAPLSLSIIMGEAIHQLRSSLDHLTTAAARLRVPAARDVHFPATGKRADFDKWKTAHARHFLPAQIAVIEGYQPFDLGAESRLFLRAIVDFDNQAKHEIVPASYAFMPVVGFAGDAEVEFLHPEPVENGSVICRCRPAPGARVTGTLDIELAYGTPRGLIRQATLRALHYYVGQIVGDVQAATPEWHGRPSN